MPLVSPQPSFGAQNHIWNPEERPNLAKQLWGIGEFLRGLRVQMRFGDLTRAPLRMLRFQLVEDFVECDCLARAPDPWDVGLRQSVRQHHATLQTLKDAIDIRTMLFAVLPHTESAHLRIFSESEGLPRELIVAGYTHRNDQSSRSVHSLVMRAKVLGFRFDLEGETLCEISGAGRSNASAHFRGLAIEARNDDFKANGRW